MADTADLTLEILKQIRDAVQQTNVRLDQTNERLDRTREELSAKLDQTNSKLDQTNSRLDQTNSRLDQTNSRLDTHERLLVRLAEESKVHSEALVKLIHEVESIHERIDHVMMGPLGGAVRDHDTRITALERDVEKLKRRTG